MICYINGSVIRQLSLSDPLLCAGLPARPYNRLVSAGIHTIQDLLECDQEKLENIDGLGPKSLEEITAFLDHLRLHPDGHRIYPLTEEHASVLGLSRKPVPDAQPEYFDTIPQDISAIPLEDLNFSVRAYNCLHRAGFKTTRDLCGMSRSDILQIRNLGRTTADEIFAVISASPRIFRPQPCSDQYSNEASRACLDFFFSLAAPNSLNGPTLFQEVCSEFQEAQDQNRPVDPSKLYRNKEIRTLVSNKLLDILKDYPFGIEKERLAHSISSLHLLPGEHLDTILSEFEQAGLILFNGSKISARHFRVMDLINLVVDDRFRDILRQRLNGATLQEIGEQYNLTKERIRQIVYQGIKKCHIVLDEDKYIPVFEKYLFTKNEFLFAYNERPETYYYLSTICSKKKRLPLAKAIEDTALPKELRCGVFHLLHRNSVCVNGEYIEKTHTAFSEYLARTFFKDEAPVEEILTKYDELLRSLGLENDSKLVLKKTSYINHLRTRDFILLTTGRKFRYYDFSKYDFTALYEGLALDQYRNAEYSTRRFFLDKPELMRRYDIRNEYELHNLLRKTCSQYNVRGVRFPRMPMIEFGKADRHRQVREILSAKSPISQNELLLEYEKRYGVVPRSISYAYLAPFMRYCRHGIFTYDEEQSPVRPAVRQISLQTNAADGAAAPPL